MLHDLIERVEAASGPDRGLDGWIHAHMTRGEPYIIGNEPGPFPRKAINGERMDVMRNLVDDPAGAADYIGAPHYTASLDMAMTLLREGSEISLTNLYGVARAHVDMNDEGGGWYGEHLGGNLALALTAACLRAQGATT